MFKVPEKYRVTNHPMLASDASFGNNGAFQVPISKSETAWIIAADGMGWEHVSVHVRFHVQFGGTPRTPTWDEMCKIKDLFWSSDDCVVQFHPPASGYVNEHPYVLHLWRPTGTNIQTPPSIMVGRQKKQL